MTRTRTKGIILDHAKAMRRAPTEPEARLWYHLRAKRLNGVKFSNQVVIGPYIADFAARSRKLVIELDGDSHGDNEIRDGRRTARLEQQGYRVIRFNNSDVMTNETAVVEAIMAALETAPLPDQHQVQTAPGCLQFVRGTNGPMLPASGEREKDADQS